MSLLELAVSDLALLERVRVAFAPGFTVITGETGAGKSLLIDALGLVLGGRADADLVREGARAARVEALFARDDEAGEPMICVREVAAGGRSVARIDDETVTLARLAATVAPLVEIHGQHEQQRLLVGAWQRDVLDAFGGHAALRGAVSTAVDAWRENEAALRELVAEPAELERLIALQEHAADEIEVLAPRPGEVEELRARLAAAANAERLARLTAAVYEQLRAEGTGARDRLAVAARDAEEAARLDARLAPLAERIVGLEAEADDVAVELRRRADASEDDRATVASLEERLGALYGLMRKYGESETDVLAHGERARAEAERLRGLDQERARREAAARQLEGDGRRAAAELHEARLAAAARLASAVTAALTELGFPGAAFDVRLDDAPLDPTGVDTVSFLLAPNPGEPPRPLARIASGGELSRVALAIKGVLAEADRTPTLIFDEVDAGIGGRSAHPVGARLWRLARSHQVVCVTHLPQIAAHADAHLRITKQVRDGRTVTEIEELAGDERVHELAAMLGGSAGGAAVASARELIEHASRVRETAAAA